MRTSAGKEDLVSQRYINDRMRARCERSLRGGRSRLSPCELTCHHLQMPSRPNARQRILALRLRRPAARGATPAAPADRAALRWKRTPAAVFDRVWRSGFASVPQHAGGSAPLGCAAMLLMGFDEALRRAGGDQQAFSRRRMRAKNVSFSRIHAFTSRTRTPLQDLSSWSPPARKSASLLPREGLKAKDTAPTCRGTISAR
jgi:hypothetical protein